MHNFHDTPEQRKLLSQAMQRAYAPAAEGSGASEGWPCVTNLVMYWLRNPESIPRPVTKRKIITSYESPPIPTNKFDWSAVRDGFEPGCGWPVGWGHSEVQAINDLIEQEEDEKAQI